MVGRLGRRSWASVQAGGQAAGVTIYFICAGGRSISQNARKAASLSWDCQLSSFSSATLAQLL